MTAPRTSAGDRLYTTILVILPAAVPPPRRAWASMRDEIRRALETGIRAIELEAVERLAPDSPRPPINPKRPAKGRSR